MEQKARVDELQIDLFAVEIVQALFQIGQGLAARRSTPRRLQRFSRRGGGTGRAGAFDGRPFIRSLAVDHPKIMALLVAQQARPVIAQGRLHIFVEDFFGFKKMSVAIDNHAPRRLLKSNSN